MKKSPSNIIFTLPNIVTFIRIIIVVFAAWALWNYNILNAFILYLCAILTDFIDGWLARLLRQVTSLGKVLDPIADKLMILSALTILFIQGKTPLWYITVIIVCSFLNLFGGLILIKKYNFVPSAIIVGKVAAVSIMITFLLNIITFQYVEYLYFLSTVLLIISVAAYIIRSFKTIKEIGK